jgi:hypothetical protein
MHRRTVLLLVTLGLVAGGVPAAANPPKGLFQPFAGSLHGEANFCKPAFHDRRSLTVGLPPGVVIDRGYQQPVKPCCGGRENSNRSVVSIPPGLYVEFSGGNEGEWLVGNVKLLADSSQIDDSGKIRGWTVEADLYCGPSCRAGGGGCNVNMGAWLATRKE